MSAVASHPSSGPSPSVRPTVSWGAIIAGAVVAAAVSLVLVLLGTGLGMAVVSPWSGGASATTLAVSALIWFVVVQWLASAAGGYITGRLRTRWSGLQGDEVFFRDTAHGFIAWCLSTLLVAGLLTSAVSGLVSKGVDSGSAIVSSAAMGAGAAAAQSSDLSDPSGYFVDLLFRPTTSSPAASGDPAAMRDEATRILVAGLAAGEIPAADKDYLASMVASRTGLDATEARARVDGVIADIDAARQKAKETAEAARKVALTTSLLTVVALLVGAFIASASAALGGQLRDDRDDVPVVARRT